MAEDERILSEGIFGIFSPFLPRLVAIKGPFSEWNQASITPSMNQ
jgi:hypothetical protein